MFVDKHINNHLKIGRIGEGIACEYLLKKQWKVILRNYRRKGDELDIVCMAPDKTLIFCEVKTLIKNGLFQPEDNLSPLKMRRITRICEFFTRKHPELINEEAGWRIDLIAVDLNFDGRALDVRHYENI